jgi:hypothetical protein
MRDLGSAHARVARTLARLLALTAMATALTCGQAARAQGVFIPMPGSAPAATGPNAVNPSAAASDVNPNALNPNAAPSAVSTLNALNPNATPSTFAPQLSAPDRSQILIGPVDPLHGIVPGSGRRREARGIHGARIQQQERLRAPAPRASSEAARRARAIMDSVCRGC